MSARFTIEVSGAELDVVRLVLGRMVEPKPIVERKPRVNLEIFNPNTGDDHLDAFMRASRLKNGPPKPRRARPVPKFPYGLKALSAQGKGSVAAFNDVAIKAWKALGYEIIVEPVEWQRGTPSPALDWRNVRVVKPELHDSKLGEKP